MHTIPHVVWGLAKHIAFGYIVFSIIQHIRGRSPSGRATVALLVGVTFPDVIDKSLVFAGILGYGRSFAHSLIVTAATAVIVRYLSRRRDQIESGKSFLIGYISHIPVDLYGPMLTGKSLDTAFLLWPLLVEYPVIKPPPTPGVPKSTIFTLIIISGFILWMYDGKPIATDIIQLFPVKD